MIDFVAALLLLLSPDVNIRWTDARSEGVQLNLIGGEDIIEPCLENGLEIRLKFELKSCRERKVWFDTCDEAVTVTRTADYDPIGERFRLKHDIRGDSEDPQDSTLNEQETTLTLLRIVPKVEIDKRVNGKSPHYLTARVVAECRGSGARALERLSSFLSFGFVSPPGFETPWVNFPLREK